MHYKSRAVHPSTVLLFNSGKYGFMKQNIGFSQFCDAFRDMGRETQFTYQGKRALFDYLESYEQDTGEEVELDVIALCCEYSEYSTATYAASEYGWKSDITETDIIGNEDRAEMQEKEALEWLNERTQVIEFDEGIIIAQF